jgi:hypothetical protein
MSNKTQEGSFTSTLPGGNPLYFKVETTYQTDTNGNPVKESAIHTLKYNPGNGVYYPAATTKDFKTFELKKYTPAEIANAGIAQFVQSDGSVLGPTAAKSLQTYDGKINKDTRNAVTNTSIKNGLSIGQSQVVQGSPQTLPNSPDTGIGSTSLEGASDIQKELKEGFKNGTRIEYGNAQYPLKLSLANQDCIKFSIIEYKAPGLTPNQSQAKSRIVKLDANKNPGFEKDRKILGTITLPIPSGINDRNAADWQDDKIDEIQQIFTGISLSTIIGGGEAGADAAKSGASAAAPGGNTNALQQRVATKFAEQATGASNILSRQFGTVANPNLELLFNGPSLRSFTFNFRFTPRELKEAQEVRKIIRYFKQAMSVKRSKSSLLLRAPHTFAISYLSKNTDHPYLNRFKECALTDCSVNYTPDGTYMTYTDSSMTAYELSLTFNELEPIFDDEYGKEKEITSIGF